MTYEYACEACGHQWEAEQSIKDPALKTCVSCGKNKAKRLVSGGTGFLLKGGGWYADGYGSKAASSSSSGEGAKGSSASSSEPASKSDSAGDSKSSTESKPAASAETKAASSEPAPKATPVASPPSKKAS
jgi:putative FmdB family regulatory protein